MCRTRFHHKHCIPQRRAQPLHLLPVTSLVSLEHNTVRHRVSVLYVCVCLHMCACTYTCMWVGVPTGAREEHQVSLSITLHHTASRQGLSLNLEMTASKALCPCSLHVYTVLGLQVQHKDFTRVLGFRFRSSNLPSKPPYPLSPLSATLNWN